MISDLFYKNILTIINDDRKWRLYYKCSFTLVLALASIVNYNCKWCYNLERHLLMTLASSIMIVIWLWCRPQYSNCFILGKWFFIYKFIVRSLWIPAMMSNVTEMFSFNFRLQLSWFLLQNFLPVAK
jgi:hypothetical protein